MEAVVQTSRFCWTETETRIYPSIRGTARWSPPEYRTAKTWNSGPKEWEWNEQGQIGQRCVLFSLYGSYFIVFISMVLLDIFYLNYSTLFILEYVLEWLLLFQRCVWSWSIWSFFIRSWFIWSNVRWSHCIGSYFIWSYFIRSHFIRYTLYGLTL